MVKFDSPLSSLRAIEGGEAIQIHYRTGLLRYARNDDEGMIKYKVKLNDQCRIFCLILFCSLYSSTAHGETSRKEISIVKKQKEILSLEQQRLLKEADTIEKMIQGLSLISDNKRQQLVDHQDEISKTLPLLVRLERANPIRMMVDPTTGEYKVRGIILMRFLISSVKYKMQQIEAELNDITIMSNDLEIKNESTRQLLQELEHQKARLSLLENKKTEAWTKEELDRLSKENDINTLLDESRSTLSKTARAASAATALKGLPFRRLEKPVVGKIFKDAALQSKFSPHSQGLFFETPKNAQVCAPAKGKVTFKGPFRTHTEILIIDHGEKAHTILMGMNKIDADIGKNVYAGEKLGTMAGYGSELPKLYLELRHKGKSIDPTPYFAIKTLE